MFESITSADLAATTGGFKYPNAPKAKIVDDRIPVKSLRGMRPSARVLHEIWHPREYLDKMYWDNKLGRL
jgi:hypothetical protein